MTDQTLFIDGRPVGPNEPPLIVAELSANHLGRLDHMIRLIEAAAEAGADAVKLQTYTPDTITINHDGPEFRISGGLWHDRTLYELYSEAHTPWEWHETLFARARDMGLTVFSSPFDESAVAFLEELDAPAYKIASFECVDLPLIRTAAATGKPLIISTGMANESEIGEAVATARTAGAGGVALLHCISAYPARIEDYNLRTLVDIGQRFDAVPGLSDHTLGTTVAVSAIALGACLIEKHMTLSRADGGPDAAFSLEPNEFRELARAGRQAWEALGTVRYTRSAEEERNAHLRPSLYIVADVGAGELLTEHNVRSIRPGYGLAPKYLPDVLGRRAQTAIARGTPLNWSMVNDDAAKH